MRIGTGPLAFDITDAQILAVQRQPPVAAISDVATAIRNALENPLNFPPLRRALTPDDHVAIVVDDHLANLPLLLTPLLEHLAAAGVTADAVTLLCLEAGWTQKIAEQLPPAFAKIKVEVHDPHNRKRLAYLAATKQGRRVYINRTAVDADQLVVLSRRYFDPLLGVGGAEGAIYPALSDADTRQAFLGSLSMAAPGDKPWPLRHEAAEVAWLLGAPFFVQVIEGAGDEVVAVVGGIIDSSAEGERLLHAHWHVTVESLADTVIAQVSGDPGRHAFADLASAAACASRVVSNDGHIILLSGSAPELGPAAQLLRQSDTPAEALQALRDQEAADRPAAFQWASAAQRAKLYLLSNIPADIVEELFAVPLESPAQVQRLVGSQPCLFLPDANKTLAAKK